MSIKAIEEDKAQTIGMIHELNIVKQSKQSTQGVFDKFGSRKGVCVTLTKLLTILSNLSQKHPMRVRY